MASNGLLCHLTLSTMAKLIVSVVGKQINDANGNSVKLRSFRGWWLKDWLCLWKTWTETCPKNVTVLHGLHVKTPKIKRISIIHTISTVFLFISYWYRTGKINKLWAVSLCGRTMSHILVQLMVQWGPSFEFYGFELCKKPSRLACIRHMLQMTINLHNIVSSLVSSFSTHRT